MNISDEAVEAAAEYLGERFFWDSPLLSEVAREVLEAAAPHLMAEAWESAYAFGFADRNVGAIPNRTNPYRSAGAGE